jgi:type II secretory pathway pseudopilin PulG
MIKTNGHGFTIIEVMLFLAVTACLVAGVLVGISTPIRNQQYRDSVYSLQSFLQQQYSEVNNVYHDSNTGLAGCTSTSYKGQSKCVILGRYIRSKTEGGITKQLLVSTVIGTIPAVSAQLDDVAIFQKGSSSGGYSVRVSSIDTDTFIYDLEWGTKMIKLKAATGHPDFSMLILRSPSSGVIRSFIDSDSVISDDKIRDKLVGDSHLKEQLVICTDPESGSLPKRAVKVNANSSTVSGVELLTDEDSKAEKCY